MSAPRKNAPGQGRPARASGGAKYKVYLYGSDHEFAKTLGQGNLSLGIRTALEVARKKVVDN